jgi:hypothetical protein
VHSGVDCETASILKRQRCLLVRILNTNRSAWWCLLVLRLVNSLGLALQQIVGRQRWRTKVRKAESFICVKGLLRVSRELWMKSLVSPFFRLKRLGRLPCSLLFFTPVDEIGHLNTALVLRVESWGSLRYWIPKRSFAVDETGVARWKRSSTAEIDDYNDEIQYNPLPITTRYWPGILRLMERLLSWSTVEVDQGKKGRQTEVDWWKSMQMKHSILQLIRCSFCSLHEES